MRSNRDAPCAPRSALLLLKLEWRAQGGFPASFDFSIRGVLCSLSVPLRFIYFQGAAQHKSALVLKVGHVGRVLTAVLDEVTGRDPSSSPATVGVLKASANQKQHTASAKLVGDTIRPDTMPYSHFCV